MSLALESLNPQQYQAVTGPLSHMIIVAGAGSGKTGVLTRRIAYLLETQQAHPHEILAVTFTNKAAREMQERLGALITGDRAGMWLGTFHGMAHRLLRRHWEVLGLAENFQIIDAEDQSRLIKRLMRELQMDEEAFPVKRCQWFINQKKGERYGESLVSAAQSPLFLELAVQYQNRCRQYGLVDFTELLVLAYELLEQHPEIAESYQNRFRFVLIDEFQDINTIQYLWFKHMAKAAVIMAVGDDDQSIYGWRGARVELMQNLEQDFSPLELIRLEQNYRSTSVILQAANALIENNPARLGKSLWTEKEGGAPIGLYNAFNEYDEARFVVAAIQKALSNGMSRSECAILYRSNAQSRVFEDALLQANIPYRVFGGLRFFDRQEIKDSVAYLRLIAHPDTDPALERIINVPARGIGDKSLEKVRMYAQLHETSLWQSIGALLADNTLPSRSHMALDQFVDFILEGRKRAQTLSLPQLLLWVQEHSGLIDYYKKEKDEVRETRLENLQELVHACEYFTAHDNPNALNDFLSHVSLSEYEQGESSDNVIQLMTLHAAKGLEFEWVFICGLEDNLFPHRLSQEQGTIDEERRLMYVGMTRARKQLYLSYASARRVHGRLQYAKPSRFLKEIPEGAIVQMGGVGMKSFSAPAIGKRQTSTRSGVSFNIPASTCPWSLGQRVKHARFGAGTIVGIEGSGDALRLQVEFQNQGSKWLVAKLANLEA